MIQSEVIKELVWKIHNEHKEQMKTLPPNSLEITILRWMIDNKVHFTSTIK